MYKLTITILTIIMGGLFWIASTPIPDTAAEASLRKNAYTLILLEEYADCVLRDTVKGDIRQRTDCTKLSKSSIAKLKAEAEKIRDLSDNEPDPKENYRLVRYAE